MIINADVAVIGAGPGGSTAAARLAELGRDVVLIDAATFPRDKPCGDGLTGVSVRLLREMGVDLAGSPCRSIRGVRVVAAHGASRDFEFPEHHGAAVAGMVVPRLELDATLFDRAVAIGATALTGWRAIEFTRVDGVVAGVRVRRGDDVATVVARFVVVATGAAQRLVRTLDLGDDDPMTTGRAMRAYATVDRPVDDLFHVYAPLRDPTSHHELCGYGWIFPVADRRVNLGVGFFNSSTGGPEVHLARLFESFRAHIGNGPDAIGLSEVGPSNGGRLSCGFVPERCHAPGVALVGDAARLVDPFTGEGIAASMESGRAAANHIDRLLADGADPAGGLPEYVRWIERRFAERFRLGEQWVRAHGFVWNVLDQTFQLDDPLFDALRRVAIDYGDSSATAEPENSSVTVDVEAVINEMVAVLSERGALASRLARELFCPVQAEQRLDALVAATGSAPVSTAHIVDLAVAIELSVLAHRVHDGTRDVPHDGQRVHAAGVSWANKFTVMMGALMLVESLRILSTFDATMTLAAAVAGRRASEAQFAGAHDASPIFLDLAAEFGAMLADMRDVQSVSA